MFSNFGITIINNFVDNISNFNISNLLNNMKQHKTKKDVINQLDKKTSKIQILARWCRFSKAISFVIFK